MSDRGSENTCRETETYLENARIVHLLSLPHVPQHNARCERSHQDVKAWLGVMPHSRGLLLTESEWQPRVNSARTHLNSRLERRMLGFKTAEEHAATLPAWYDAPRAIDRDVFYFACKAAVANALLGIEDIHERRLAEREAILCTAEQFGLLIRTRGDTLPPATRNRKE